MKKMTLNMENISIEFPGVKALQQVHFIAETGKVHALIGANGAGKSTLMKVLSGSYTHYTGDIFINEEKISVNSPKEALQYGIQIVHQEVDTGLIPYLTVGENIMLHKVEENFWVNWKKVHKEAEAVLRSVDVQVPSTKLVRDLTLAEKQMVLIARALTTECKFLLLDEPTASLSKKETDQLFKIVRELMRKNVGVIFISHRLPEIFALCDQITVMRNGKVVGQEATHVTTPNKVVELMLGKTLEDQFPERKATTGETLLQVNGLTDSNMLSNMDLHVKKGEIVGIAGLVGAGKSELCKALFGCEPITSGELMIGNEKVKIKSPTDAVSKGIAFIPEERRKEGVLISESVAVNMTAANLHAVSNKYHFLNKRIENQKTNELINRLGVKTPSSKTKVQFLSGGNQQKIVIGKWLLTDADLYIFDEPTKGIDVGAKKDIFELIHQLAVRGKGILYASSETAEIIGLTNRTYVLYDGKIVKEVTTSETSEEEILYYATGGTDYGK
ncbi:sugar ABC transporter ATP-binding protein [Sutcliffiella sp. NC1]|uniref:sugar ABC transporter ATP-binding protein n=1 Tax=Sutcliffiella sp. NC1 TaxID=3004096 RepID=UPI0022DDD469|nr:sugar ABC transporter ATP-binding protein [Sutcliffiella sp. NC1]WBL13804.1 sugar ABC transporter ATP-binding protein [Sutcliffiella sp. NC1]